MNKWKFAVPADDAGANDKYQQFRTNFQVHFAALGFDAADLDNVIDAANAFNTSLIEANAAKDAARNAVAVKDNTRPVTNEVIRSYVERCILNPAADPKVLADLGITPAQTGAGPVVPPINLSATAKADGSCTLKWGRSLNANGTVWVVESAEADGAWEFLSISTRTQFVDTDATPGVQRSYRVRAQRNGVTSAPSDAATIYLGGDGVSLQIAA